MSDTSPKPFPALTPTQRLHIEINGYVVIENVLMLNEVETLKETIYRIEADFRRTGELPGPHCFHTSTTQEFFRIDNVPHLAPCFFDYLTNPRIVGMAEEAIGGPARLQQSDAHLRRQVAVAEPGSRCWCGNPDCRRQGGHHFHRGINPAYTHYEQGLYHFSFVKALTNLTDLGPDDGGTTVIGGTHKVPPTIPQDDIIDAALQDASRIHRVEAPAGSTLLFYESLLHSAGIIESGEDRLLILGGYMPTMFQAWKGYDPDPEFVKTLSDEHRALLTGEAKFDWQRHPRHLGESAARVQIAATGHTDDGAAVSI